MKMKAITPGVCASFQSTDRWPSERLEEGAARTRGTGRVREWGNFVDGLRCSSRAQGHRTDALLVPAARGPARSARVALNSECGPLVPVNYRWIIILVLVDLALFDFS
jgi:hypothetical protein